MDDRNDQRTTTLEPPETAERDANRDPITGAPGSHPVGTGVGAASGGAVGAAIGAVGGPLGALLGGTIGAIAGGAAGHAVGERVDPTYDGDYFNQHHAAAEWGGTDDYDRYEPAYQYGWKARRATLGSRWEDWDRGMEREWQGLENRGDLSWNEARPAARSAWDRADQRFTGTLRDEDDYWRENYRNRDYVVEGETYDRYRPAYRYGAESRLRHGDSRFDDVEQRLADDWERRPDRGDLTWERAKQAVRDGWHRVERALPGDADRDGR
jgi:hypothetical protein